MPDSPPDERAERLAALERDHAELTASLPAHSIPASLLLRIEALEEEIAALRAEDPSPNPSPHAERDLRLPFLRERGKGSGG